MNLLRQWMIFAGLITWLAMGMTARSATPSEETPPVALAPVKVHASWIVVTYFATPEDRIQKVMVTEVTPRSPAERAAIRNRDELIAIEDRPVQGMSVDDFVNLYEKPVPPRQSKRYIFRCFRGFLGRTEKRLEFTISASPVAPSS